MHQRDEPVDGQQHQPDGGNAGALARPRAICDHLTPILDDLNPGIVAPEIQAAHFELKPVMFNMLNSIGQFGGSPHKDARQHIRAFLKVFDSFRQQGVHEDVLKLKLFSYSLRDRARAWLSGVPAGSLESWADLCRSFLMRYNPPNMHTQLRNDIASFRQGDDESMMMLDASANGTLLDKSPEEAFEILDRIANNDYQFPTSRLGSGRRTSGKLELDANDSVSAQLSAITNLLKNLQKPSDVREAKALSCVHCEGNHHATDCPVMHEQASYLGNYNRNSNNPYSNTYNPGWRQHLNFSWNNQGGTNASSSNRQQNTNAPPGFQANMPWHSESKGNAPLSSSNSMEATMQEFISTTKTMLQEHSTSIKHHWNMLQTQGALLQSHSSSLRALETQVGQIAQAFALTLRSGKEINKDDKFGGKHVEDPTPSNEQKELEVEIDSPIEEDKGEKLDTEKTEEQHANATASAVPKPTRDEVRPPPPFPQCLKKHKEDLQFQKFVSMLDQFHINIPFLEAIEQVPSYAKFLKDIVTKKRRAESYETVAVASEYCAGRVELPIKKKDPGSFIIPCSIGNNFMGNALCDLGSSVNLMPKAVFKKLGIGIERPTTVILQLADRSHVRPEGKVEDVIVKVGKFVFHVDFLILD
ncbi:hypothetical protein GQ457_02G023750 [Hibiscus cannabinus]